jgi:hypothetical protein
VHRLIKKIHMYTGLVNFTILVVFAIVGLTAAFLPGPNQRPRPKAEVRYVDFTAPGGLDDRQVADRIYEELQLPLTSRAQDWNIRRGEDHNLRVRFPTASKVYTAVVLENESRLRLEIVPFDTWQFLSHLHESTPQHANPDWRAYLWSCYVEFSLWSLILMAVSGVYLWLASRPSYRWAQVSFGMGCGTLLLYYLLVR